MRGSSQRQPVVLVVDDEPDILEAFQAFLSGSIPDLRIHTATTGQEGLDLLRREPVDLILSDYRMPGMTGVEFLKEAARLAPGSRRMMVTAFPDVKLAMRALEEAKIHHFSTKPLDPKKVVKAVQGLLEEAASERRKGEGPRPSRESPRQEGEWPSREG